MAGEYEPSPGLAAMAGLALTLVARQVARNKFFMV
jgi:hypothetical protein